jgi:hypothetical protein
MQLSEWGTNVLPEEPKGVVQLSAPNGKTTRFDGRLYQSSQCDNQF